MLEIEKPRIECIERLENGHYAKFSVEPLERGYGLTLGNSLKRILLSSIEGSAVTSVKIEGVLEMCSKIPGVLEEVTDIILNLQSLVLKSYTNEPRVLRIESQGRGIVTAGDIISHPDIEILNTDLKIATLDNDGRLFMEMTVECGCGCINADKNKKPNHIIGVIPIDSNFAPIIKVSYSVETILVGQTNYDKLTIETWSNGSISPEEATSAAAKILSDHLRFFTVLTDKHREVENMVDKEESKDKILKMLIVDLNLSGRPCTCLRRAGIKTVEELIQKTEKDMIEMRNLGIKSYEEVKTKLQKLGLGFKGDED